MSTTQSDENTTVLTQFEKFYTSLSSDNLKQLADLYTEDVTFVDPVTQHQGLPALVAYFENLLENCQSCTFDIFDKHTDSEQATVTWQLNFTHPKLRAGRLIHVTGISIMKFRDGKISHQQDFYDLGAMLYEHVPVLGGMIRALRKRLAA